MVQVDTSSGTAGPATPRRFPRVKIAYFDPFSGASGDMILGALVDAGLPFGDLTRELGKLRLGGYEIRAEQAGQHGIHGTRVVVNLTEHHHSRTWADIRSLIDASELDAPIKQAATAIFERLAAAEAKIHSATPDSVHFHEVGGVDAIVDICGACIGLARLGVEAVYVGPSQVGSGFANSAHGLIPIPAPATLELLAAASVEIAIPIPAMRQTPAEAGGAADPNRGRDPHHPRHFWPTVDRAVRDWLRFRPEGVAVAECPARLDWRAGQRISRGRW
jgi:uncharacterized protein (DUF111 family)